MKISEIIFIFSMITINGIQVLAWFWLPKTLKGERVVGAMGSFLLAIMIVSGVTSAIMWSEESHLAEIIIYSLIVLIPLWIVSRLIMLRKNREVANDG